MNDFWQSLTQEHTVHQSIDEPAQNYLMPLSQMGILTVTGDDASNFLQNLLTNDVKALVANQSQLTGICTAKGRLLANFLLINTNDSYLLVLPKTMCASLKQRLSMYVLRSKVTISDSSDEVIAFGLYQNTPTMVAELPEQEHQLSAANNANFIKLPSQSKPRYLCLTTSDNAMELTQSLLEQDWIFAQEANWNLLDINAGIPTIYSETKEKFTPQQVNFDLIGGVSFNKGCYPGQEIVARLHYLGSPSRRMFSASSELSIESDAGDEVTSAGGQVLGHIVTVQRCADNEMKLLLSLKLAEQEQQMFIAKTVTISNIVTLAND